MVFLLQWKDFQESCSKWEKCTLYWLLLCKYSTPVTQPPLFPMPSSTKTSLMEMEMEKVRSLDWLLKNCNWIDSADFAKAVTIFLIVKKIFFYILNKMLAWTGILNTRYTRILKQEFKSNTTVFPHICVHVVSHKNPSHHFLLYVFFDKLQICLSKYVTGRKTIYSHNVRF